MLGECRHSLLIGLQVGHVSGQQVATLAGLCIPDSHIEKIELPHGQRCAVHGVHRIGARFGGSEIDDGDDEGGEGRHHKPCHQCTRNGKAGGRLGLEDRGMRCRSVRLLEQRLYRVYGRLGSRAAHPWRVQRPGRCGRQAGGHHVGVTNSEAIARPLSGRYSCGGWPSPTRSEGA